MNLTRHDPLSDSPDSLLAMCDEQGIHPCCGRDIGYCGCAAQVLDEVRTALRGSATAPDPLHPGPHVDLLDAYYPNEPYGFGVYHSVAS